MATFTDIYKQELKNKGVLSSIGSAAFKRTLEKVDPRNILFGGKGFVSATGQKIFGKGYSGVTRAEPAKKISDGTALSNQALAQLLISSKNQEAQLSIIAKNTMNMNSMARDMNVMRQNMMKLVTMGGGKASRGADMFFKNAAARESEYESKFKKMTSPTPVGEKKTDEGKSGIFGSLMGIGGSIVTAIVGVLRGIPEIIGKVLSSVFSVSNLSKILGFSASVLGDLGSFLLKISPLLLKLTPILVAVAGATWLLRWLSEKNKEANTEEEIKDRFESGAGSTRARGAGDNLSAGQARDLLKSLNDSEILQETGLTRSEIERELASGKTNIRLNKNFDRQQRVQALESQQNDRELARAAAQTNRPQPTPTSPTKISTLGAIAGKYESGTGGVGTISNAMGGKDPGGVSYGKYQLSSTQGTMAKFLRSEEGRAFAPYFDNLKPGTKEFNDVYKKIAAEQGEAFNKAQHDFVVKNNFKPVLKLAKDLGFNVDDAGVQEALFSQSVQHGLKGNKEILEKTMKLLGPNSTAQEQITKLYEQRSAYVNNLSSLDSNIKSNILKRYMSESRDVLALSGQPSTTGTALAAASSQASQMRTQMAIAPTTTVVPVPTPTTTTKTAPQDSKIVSAFNTDMAELLFGNAVDLSGT